MSNPSSERSSVSRAIIIDPVNDPRWDKFVEGHPFGLICHLSGWKQVLEESFPHMKGYYLALLGNDNDSIRAALPTFEVKSILTGKRLVSIPFATNCDPLISSNEDMRELLDSVIELSTKLEIPRIELRTLVSWPLIQDPRINSIIYHKSHQLSLEAAPEKLVKNFSRQVRRKIKEHLKGDVEFKIAGNESDLLEFYHLYVKTRKRLGLPPQPYLFFKSLWEKFLFPQHISLLVAKHKKQLVAGMIMFKFNNRFSCEYLASSVTFKNINIDYLIYWEAIKIAHSEGYKLFDFGRTGINNTGLMSFKNLWGTTVVNLPQFFYPKKLYSGLNYREESMPYKIIRRINKNVPDSVFQFMGKFLYRHLG